MISPLLTAEFSWLGFSDVQFFCLAVQSEHGGLCTHIYLCHATPGQVSAMQWLPLLSSACLCATLLSPNRQIEKHTRTDVHMHKFLEKITTHRLTQEVDWIGQLLQLYSKVRSFPYSPNSISPLSSSFPNPPNIDSLFALLFSPTHPLLYWPSWPCCLSPIDLNIQLDGRDTWQGERTVSKRSPVSPLTLSPSRLFLSTAIAAEKIW